jgi:hypothetical protein
MQNKISAHHEAENTEMDYGTLRDGYVHTSPLPQVPTRQSVPTSEKCLPTYFGIPLLISTLRRAILPFNS